MDKNNSDVSYLFAVLTESAEAKEPGPAVEAPALVHGLPGVLAAMTG